MFYSLLADFIVALHTGYVAFVVLGQVTILWGAVRKWEWIRNLWFRLGHLSAIVVVALEEAAGITCPLTLWEDRLRRAAGQSVAEGSFVGRWLHSFLFYDFPPWVFTVVYLGFALLVLATFVWVPPRWRLRARFYS